MSQTSYDINQGESYAGMKADSRFDTVESKIAEGAIPFGIGVVAGTDAERQVKTAALSTDTFRGVSVHEHVEKDASGNAQYADEKMVSVLRKGLIVVVVETTVAAPAIDDDAYVNTAVGGAELGRFTEVSTGNIATGGKFRKVGLTGPDGEALALVEINLP